MQTLSLRACSDLYMIRLVHIANNDGCAEQFLCPRGHILSRTPGPYYSFPLILSPSSLSLPPVLPSNPSMLMLRASLLACACACGCACLFRRTNQFSFPSRPPASFFWLVRFGGPCSEHTEFAQGLLFSTTRRRRPLPVLTHKYGQVWHVRLWVTAHQYLGSSLCPPTILRSNKLVNWCPLIVCRVLVQG